MKHNDRAVKTTILCAIQLKTVKSCQKSDAAKVVPTIDPNLWFSSKPGKKMKSALGDAIKLWDGTIELITVLFTTSVSTQEFFAFKHCSVLSPSRSTVGKMIVEEALQIIADEEKTSLSEEDGKRIIANAHQTVTDKPWGKLSKNGAGQSVMDGSLSSSRNLSRSGDSAQENVGGQQDTFPRRCFRFTVLEQRHTATFFGKSVDELIGLIKDMKRDLPEDEGEELNKDELGALMKELGELKVDQLKFCLKSWGFTGYSKLRKGKLVELVLQQARRLGFDEVLNVVKHTARLESTKRKATQGLVTGSI